MISEVNLYSVPTSFSGDSSPEVCIHVAIENQKGIETHLFSTDNIYYVDNFMQWLHENITQSEADLDIVINGRNNTMYSIYFELLRTYPKVSLAKFNQ